MTVRWTRFPSLRWSALTQPSYLGTPDVPLSFINWFWQYRPMRNLNGGHTPYMQHVQLMWHSLQSDPKSKTQMDRVQLHGSA